MTDWGTTRHVVVTGAESNTVESVTNSLADTEGLEAESVVDSALLDTVASTPPDAVVVVDDPPASDGIDVFRRLRADDWLLPVVLVSETQSQTRVETALSAGVTEYVSGYTDEQAGDLAARIVAHVETPVLDGAAQADQWRDVVSSLTHDTKNPVNVVTGRLELLDIEATHADAIGRSMGRVDLLLDELSTIAAVAGPVTETEPVDLAETARAVWDSLVTDTAQLRVETDQTIDANPARLELVFERLFENALQHAGPDVTVTVGDSDNGFYIADDGPGIADRDGSSVLEQGYGTTRNGEGYGLFVAQRAVAAHGWELTTTNEDGARFDVCRR